MIDLRSDTVTRPTAGMRAAMAAADVGDEQFREDPTTNELQRRMAELLGQEAALFLPTATMANEIALRILTRPGGLLLAEERTHVLVYEFGGPAVHSGLIMQGLVANAGRPSLDQIRTAVAACDAPRDASVLVLENTHRSSGARIWPFDEFTDTVALARELGLAVHLDGARLFNASVAAGLPPSAWAQHADTVTVCFSKGLGCPTGAIIAGSAELMEKAWNDKFLFGGALRQSGVIAAAMLYALDTHVDRLADDHARARRLAEGLAAAGMEIDVDAVETNFISIDLAPIGLGEPEAEKRLAAHGVLLGHMRPGILRAATHLDISDDDIDRAIDAIPAALGIRAAARA
ncbi:MAG TPA: GntG family PLP-dependent aldolase [Gaiellaceae bacterium]|nr:GntG family PLP-dependent aldolase [Gaiellaceae bacterium]